VREVTDELIEVSKAQHRGLVLDQLLGILATCVEVGVGDPRYLEIRIKVAGMLIRLLKLEEPMRVDVERSGEGDRRALVERAAQTLLELEARRGS